MPVAPVEGSHLVVNGDSWWTLAERAYGDGRLYRALYAWNRTLDPRVALLPGTRLDIPPVERLTAAWPGLVPTRP
jgi:5'-nucleotidase